jgi:hypothetical protein
MAEDILITISGDASDVNQTLDDILARILEMQKQLNNLQSNVNNIGGNKNLQSSFEGTSDAIKESTVDLKNLLGEAKEASGIFRTIAGALKNAFSGNKAQSSGMFENLPKEAAKAGQQAGKAAVTEFQKAFQHSMDASASNSLKGMVKGIMGMTDALDLGAAGKGLNSVLEKDLVSPLRNMVTIMEQVETRLNSLNFDNLQNLNVAGMAGHFNSIYKLMDEATEAIRALQHMQEIINAAANSPETEAGKNYQARQKEFDDYLAVLKTFEQNLTNTIDSISKRLVDAKILFEELTLLQTKLHPGAIKPYDVKAMRNMGFLENDEPWLNHVRDLTEDPVFASNLAYIQDYLKQMHLLWEDAGKSFGGNGKMGLGYLADIQVIEAAKVAVKQFLDEAKNITHVEELWKSFYKLLGQLKHSKFGNATETMQKMVKGLAKGLETVMPELKAMVDKFRAQNVLPKNIPVRPPTVEEPEPPRKPSRPGGPSTAYRRAADVESMSGIPRDPMKDVKAKWNANKQWANDTKRGFQEVSVSGKRAAQEVKDTWQDAIAATTKAQEDFIQQQQALQSNIAQALGVGMPENDAAAKHQAKEYWDYQLNLAKNYRKKVAEDAKAARSKSNSLVDGQAIALVNQPIARSLAEGGFKETARQINSFTSSLREATNGTADLSNNIADSSVNLAHLYSSARLAKDELKNLNKALPTGPNSRFAIRFSLPPETVNWSNELFNDFMTTGTDAVEVVRNFVSESHKAGAQVPEEINAVISRWDALGASMEKVMSLTTPAFSSKEALMKRTGPLKGTVNFDEEINPNIKALVPYGQGIDARISELFKGIDVSTMQGNLDMMARVIAFGFKKMTEAKEQGIWEFIKSGNLAQLGLASMDPKEFQRQLTGRVGNMLKYLEAANAKLLYRTKTIDTDKSRYNRELAEKAETGDTTPTRPTQYSTGYQADLIKGMQLLRRWRDEIVDNNIAAIANEDTWKRINRELKRGVTNLLEYGKLDRSNQLEAYIQELTQVSTPAEALITPDTDSLAFLDEVDDKLGYLRETLIDINKQSMLTEIEAGNMDPLINAMDDISALTDGIEADIKVLTANTEDWGQQTSDLPEKYLEIRDTLHEILTVATAIGTSPNTFGYQALLKLSAYAGDARGDISDMRTQAALAYIVFDQMSEKLYTIASTLSFLPKQNLDSILTAKGLSGFLDAETGISAYNRALYAKIEAEKEDIKYLDILREKQAELTSSYRPKAALPATSYDWKSAGNINYTEIEKNLDRSEELIALAQQVNQAIEFTDIGKMSEEATLKLEHLRDEVTYVYESLGGTPTEAIEFWENLIKEATRGATTLPQALSQINDAIYEWLKDFEAPPIILSTEIRHFADSTAVSGIREILEDVKPAFDISNAEYTGTPPPVALPAVVDVSAKEAPQVQGTVFSGQEAIVKDLQLVVENTTSSLGGMYTELFNLLVPINQVTNLDVWNALMEKWKALNEQLDMLAKTAETLANTNLSAPSGVLRVGDIESPIATVNESLRANLTDTAQGLIALRAEVTQTVQATEELNKPITLNVDEALRVAQVSMNLFGESIVRMKEQIASAFSNEGIQGEWKKMMTEDLQAIIAKVTELATTISTVKFSEAGTVTEETLGNLRNMVDQLSQSFTQLNSLFIGSTKGISGGTQAFDDMTAAYINIKTTIEGDPIKVSVDIETLKADQFVTDAKDALNEVSTVLSSWKTTQDGTVTIGFDVDISSLPNQSEVLQKIKDTFEGGFTGVLNIDTTPIEDAIPKLHSLEEAVKNSTGEIPPPDPQPFNDAVNGAAENAKNASEGIKVTLTEVIGYITTLFNALRESSTAMGEVFTSITSRGKILDIGQATSWSPEAFNQITEAYRTLYAQLDPTQLQGRLLQLQEAFNQFKGVATLSLEDISRAMANFNGANPRSFGQVAAQIAAIGTQLQSVGVDLKATFGESAAIGVGVLIDAWNRAREVMAEVAEGNRSVEESFRAITEAAGGAGGGSGGTPPPSGPSSGSPSPSGPLPFGIINNGAPTTDLMTGAVKDLKDAFAKMGSEALSSLTGIFSWMNKIKVTASGLIKLMAGLFVVREVAALAKSFLQVAVNMEKYRTMLMAVLGSQQSVQKAFKEINDWATMNPVDTDEAVKAFTFLKVSGVDAGKSIKASINGSMSELPAISTLEATKAVGNVAAIYSRSMDDIARAVISTQTMALRRIGINVDRSGKQAIVQSGKVRVAVAKDVDSIRQAILYVMEQQYGDMMDYYTHTFEGNIKTLKGMWERIKQDAMGTEFEQGSPFKLLRDELNVFRDEFEAWIKSSEYPTFIENLRGSLKSIVTVVIAVTKAIMEFSRYMIENRDIIVSTVTAIAKVWAVFTGYKVLKAVVTNLGAVFAALIKIIGLKSATSTIAQLAASIRLFGAGKVGFGTVASSALGLGGAIASLTVKLGAALYVWGQYKKAVAEAAVATVNMEAASAKTEIVGNAFTRAFIGLTAAQAKSVEGMEALNKALDDIASKMAQNADKFTKPFKAIDTEIDNLLKGPMNNLAIGVDYLLEKISEGLFGIPYENMFEGLDRQSKEALDRTAESITQFHDEAKQQLIDTFQTKELEEFEARINGMKPEQLATELQAVQRKIEVLHIASKIFQKVGLDKLNVDEFIKELSASGVKEDEIETLFREFQNKTLDQMNLKNLRTQIVDAGEALIKIQQQLMGGLVSTQLTAEAELELEISKSTWEGVEQEYGRAWDNLVNQGEKAVAEYKALVDELDKQFSQGKITADEYNKALYGALGVDYVRKPHDIKEDESSYESVVTLPTGQVLRGEELQAARVALEEQQAFLDKLRAQEEDMKKGFTNWDDPNSTIYVNLAAERVTASTELAEQKLDSLSGVIKQGKGDFDGLAGAENEASKVTEAFKVKIDRLKKAFGANIITGKEMEDVIEDMRASANPKELTQLEKALTSAEVGFFSTTNAALEAANAIRKEFNLIPYTLDEAMEAGVETVEKAFAYEQEVSVKAAKEIVAAWKSEIVAIHAAIASGDMTIDEAIERLKAIETEAQNGVDAATELGTAGEKLGTAIGKGATAAGKELEDLRKKMQDFLSRISEQVNQGFIGPAEALEQLATIFTLTAAEASAKWNELEEHQRDAFNQVQEYSQELLSLNLDTAFWKWNDALIAAKDSAKGFREEILGITEAFLLNEQLSPETKFEGIAQSFQSVVDVWDKGQVSGQDMERVIDDLVNSEGVQKLRDEFPPIFQRITNEAASAKDSIQTFAEKLTDIVPTVTEWEDAFVNAADSIAEGFANAVVTGDDLGETFKNIGNELAIFMAKAMIMQALKPLFEPLGFMFNTSGNPGGGLSGMFGSMLGMNPATTGGGLLGQQSASTTITSAMTMVNGPVSGDLLGAAGGLFDTLAPTANQLTNSFLSLDNSSNMLGTTFGSLFNSGGLIGDVFSQAGGQVASSLGALTSETSSVTGSFGGLGGILGEVAGGFMNLLSSIGSIIGSVFSGIGGLFGLSQGGVLWNGKITPFASGGVVGGPTAFPLRNGIGVMGEAGKEAVMPLSRTSNGDLGISVADSVTQPTIINVLDPSQVQILAMQAVASNPGTKLIYNNINMLGREGSSKAFGRGGVNQ